MPEFKLEIPVERASVVSQIDKGRDGGRCERVSGWRRGRSRDGGRRPGKIARYVALLDQLGWEDDGQGGVVAFDDVEFARGFLLISLSGLGEDMRVATGDYEAHDLDLDAVRLVSSRGCWLTDELMSFDVEAVTA